MDRIALYNGMEWELFSCFVPTVKHTQPQNYVIPTIVVHHAIPTIIVL